MPVLTLKGNALSAGRSGVGMRKVLIVFQFTISLLFIVAAGADGGYRQSCGKSAG
jgi:hypothetical protein